ncbi:MAG: hypothetical protein ACE5JI_22010, partial [Acidobacteriota bacterium]
MTLDGPPEGHLSPEEVYRFLERTAARSELRSIERHLDECRDCVGYLGTVMRSSRCATPEEAQALSRLPARSAPELYRRLRPRIVATSPSSMARRGFGWNWPKLLATATSLAGLLAVLWVIESQLIAPARSRRLAAQALDQLVELRQGTGRIPLRYVDGFERARMTRSSFAPAGQDRQREDDIEARLERAVQLAPGELAAHLALGLFWLDGGAVESAEGELRRALEIDRESIEAANGLAVVLYERALRAPDEARELKRQGLALLEDAHRRRPG